MRTSSLKTPGLLSSRPVETVHVISALGRWKQRMQSSRPSLTGSQPALYGMEVSGGRGSQRAEVMTGSGDAQQLYEPVPRGQLCFLPTNSYTENYQILH